MNIAEIRQKYPQYENISDEQLVTGLHKKFYSDMDFNDFSNRIGYSKPKMPNISQEQADIVKANNEAYKNKYDGINTLDKVSMGASKFTGDDLSNISGEALVGGEKVLDGATLGAYGLLNKNLGGNYKEREQRFYNTTDSAGIPKIVSRGATIIPEIAGNIAGVGGALVKGLAKGGKGLTGLKLATTTGGIEGAGYGATSSNSLDELPANILKGGAIGATMGGLGYGATKTALKGIGKASDKVVNNIRRLSDKADYNNTKLAGYIENELGTESLKNLVKEANKTGRSIIEVADDRTLQVAKNMIANSDDARVVFTQHANELKKTSGIRARKEFDKVLGDKNAFDNISDIRKSYSSKAKPLYDNSFNKYSDIKIDKDFINLTQDEIIGDALNKVSTRQGVRNSDAVNSLRRLDGVKKYIDDEIGGAIRAGRNNEARILQEAKNKLVNYLDDIAPEYKQARKLYSDEYALKEAQELGLSFLDSSKGKTTGDFIRELKDFTPAQREAFKVGVRERIIENLGKSENETLNLKSLLSKNTQDKLIAGLGKKDANRIIRFGKDEFKRMRNLNEVLGQSQTAELLRMRKEPLFDRAMARYGNPNLAGATAQLAKDTVSLLGKKARADRYGNMSRLFTSKNQKGLKKGLENVINAPSRKIDDWFNRLVYITPKTP